MANNGSAKIISKKRVVYARPGRSGHRLAIIPNPVCVGVVASHILAADANADADPIRWRQPRIPADSIFASCRNFPPDPVEIRSFFQNSQPPPCVPSVSCRRQTCIDRPDPLPTQIIFLSLSRLSGGGQSIEKIRRNERQKMK